MKARITSLVTGVALAATLVLGTAGVATAASPAPVAPGAPVGGPSGSGVCAVQLAAIKAGDTIADLRAFGDCEINRRFATLTATQAKVNASKFLTSSDAAALTGEISSTTAGLTSLKAKIDADTDVKVLRADIVKIATDYRVYLLVVPQAALTMAADAVVASQTKFSELNTDLVAAIAKAKAAGKDTAAAQSDLDAMNASVAAAVALAQPVPGAVLPLTPAQYNGGTAGPILKSSRTALGTARNDLQTALADAKACRAALQ